MNINLFYVMKHFAPNIYSLFKCDKNDSTCQTNGQTVCEQNVCLIDDSLVQNVNSIANTLGWRAANYSEFWGRKYTEGLQLRLGTIDSNFSSYYQLIEYSELNENLIL